MERDHDRQGQPENEDLIRQHAHAGQQLHRELELARVVVRLVSPDEDDQVTHDERGPERGEDHREG